MLIFWIDIAWGLQKLGTILEKKRWFLTQQIDFKNSNFMNSKYLALYQFTNYGSFLEAHTFFFDKIKGILIPQVRNFTNHLTRTVLQTFLNLYSEYNFCIMNVLLHYSFKSYFLKSILWIFLFHSFTLLPLWKCRPIEK